MYEWLAREIAVVQTRRFHVVEAVPDLSVLEAPGGAVPASYKAFLVQFGAARLYRSGSAYLVGIRSDWQASVAASGAPLRGIGHYQDAQAYYQEQTLDGEHEAPVFEWGAGGLRRVAGTFADWLEARCRAARGQYGRKQWEAIVKGPSPFSVAEQRIVEARRLFRWSLVGGTVDGPLQFEVANESTMTLPFISIGIRRAGANWVGAIWLPVGHVRPGTKAVVAHPCYPQVPRAELEPYSLPDPEPEDRDRYWEFRVVEEGRPTSGCS